MLKEINMVPIKLVQLKLSRYETREWNKNDSCWIYMDKLIGLFQEQWWVNGVCQETWIFSPITMKGRVRLDYEFRHIWVKYKGIIKFENISNFVCLCTMALKYGKTLSSQYPFWISVPAYIDRGKEQWTWLYWGSRDGVCATQCPLVFLSEICYFVSLCLIQKKHVKMS